MTGIQMRRWRFSYGVTIGGVRRDWQFVEVGDGVPDYSYAQTRKFHNLTEIFQT